MESIRSNETTQRGYDTFSTSNSINELPGIGLVPISKEEMTSPKLVADYKELLRQLNEIMNKQGEFNEEDVAKLQKIVDALGKLAKEGDTTTTPPSYMQPEMLTNLKPILELLSVIGGITPNGTANNETSLLGLKTLKEYQKSDQGRTITFNSILASALNTSGSDTSLQAMLYTEFVRGANQIFEKKLLALEEQLKLSKKIADLLAKLQDYRNENISVPSTPNWADNPNATPPVVKNATTQNFYELIKYRDDLKALIKELESQGVLVKEEGSIANALQKVVDDLDNAGFKNIKLEDLPKTDEEVEWLKRNDYGKYDKYQYAKMTGRSAWLMDSNTQAGGNAGNYQDNITKAITATESLNDTQKEELRSVQYIYEQFIKIATSLMQLLQKIIEKPAQNIAR